MTYASACAWITWYSHRAKLMVSSIIASHPCPESASLHTPPPPPHFHCHVLSVWLYLLNSRYNRSSSTSVSSILRLILQMTWESIQSFLVNLWWAFIFFMVTSGFRLASLPWSLFLSLADCGDMNTDIQICGEKKNLASLFSASQTLHPQQSRASDLFCTLSTFTFRILYFAIWLALHFCICSFDTFEHWDTMSNITISHWNWGFVRNS